MQKFVSSIQLLCFPALPKMLMKLVRARVGGPKALGPKRRTCLFLQCFGLGRAFLKPKGSVSRFFEPLVKEAGPTKVRETQGQDGFQEHQKACSPLRKMYLHSPQMIPGLPGSGTWTVFQRDSSQRGDFQRVALWQGVRRVLPGTLSSKRENFAIFTVPSVAPLMRSQSPPPKASTKQMERILGGRALQ